jgi:hypothetical protein
MKLELFESSFGLSVRRKHGGSDDARADGDSDDACADLQTNAPTNSGTQMMSKYCCQDSSLREGNRPRLRSYPAAALCRRAATIGSMTCKESLRNSI